MTSKKELKDYYYSPESAYEQSGGQLIHQEDKEFMDAVTAIIRENLDKETLRLELIAEKMGMNTRSLYRRFKKISPLTPSDFIKDYRFNYAAQLLVTTNLSVQEIIYKSRHFEQVLFLPGILLPNYNQTPTEYRNKQKVKLPGDKSRFRTGICKTSGGKVLISTNLIRECPDLPKSVN